MAQDAEEDGIQRSYSSEKAARAGSLSLVEGYGIEATRLCRGTRSSDLRLGLAGRLDWSWSPTKWIRGGGECMRSTCTLLMIAARTHSFPSCYAPGYKMLPSATSLTISCLQYVLHIHSLIHFLSHRPHQRVSRHKSESWLLYPHSQPCYFDHPRGRL